MELAEQLVLIAEHAPKLRAAGVQSLSVGAISMVLAPPDPPQSEAPAIVAPKTLMEDPEMYGLPDGAQIPGFVRPEGV